MCELTWPKWIFQTLVLLSSESKPNEDCCCVLYLMAGAGFSAVDCCYPVSSQNPDPHGGQNIQLPHTWTHDNHCALGPRSNAVEGLHHRPESSCISQVQVLYGVVGTVNTAVGTGYLALDSPSSYPSVVLLLDCRMDQEVVGYSEEACGSEGRAASGEVRRVARHVDGDNSLGAG